MFEKNLLNGQTIVITGGGTGLGKSMSRRFGELGANIVISGRRKEKLEETADEFSKLGINVLTCPGDVRKLEDVELLFGECPSVIIVTISQSNLYDLVVLAKKHDVHTQTIGKVTDDSMLKINDKISINKKKLSEKYFTSLEMILKS